MKGKYYLTICLLAGIISCQSGGQAKVATSSAGSASSSHISERKSDGGLKELKGVLIVHTDSVDLAKATFSVLNPDKSIYAKIESVGDNEPSSDMLNGRILAYYPEYYIVHFNADILSDSLYSVSVGANTKLIRKGAYVEYVSWPDYILRFFATTTKANPLRIEPSLSASTVPNLDYSKLSFRCLEISEDWVKVSCNKDCEGCPDGKEVVGWIKWKENGKVILKQYYTC